MKPKPKRAAKLLPKRTAVEVLEETLYLARDFAHLALPHRRNPLSNEKTSLKWMKILVEAASALAPYQSPPWAPMLLPKEVYDKAYERLGTLSPEEIRKHLRHKSERGLFAHLRSEETRKWITLKPRRKARRKK